ncbi:1,2-dihydroxy-3-keto-5-methylthiopentene dioxygenase [Granulibacter bethesdensis]|uniref:Acireductone dioxygenase n=2 Tax=Granulibacter bethesdensis TaxID=364410 RepID=MTND_GRABC|nr:cupin domain-containing protein [Granulibacter bethesdensis]Q0BPT8.1 RecName: Full=Acireductone dioxygenase; AltName: Full=1,2-dihydroxy-3-keto-5-methylthiopentene dioxygenase; Short=DHK-MTPene dioxygenase; AltName: Full=Acireductone dioxygenase (Fe(2+)-requiring); Short=ARD'; Short=Fe-ARD; AltName: Full=Acireductone dioxygenase (Ni(2+)-requiring); Short=ARD; Short=Ni-ARD [Granulibacter bethesdensis CGDNIH1]ABI63164.1 Acireductone dioxygenase (Fe(2+)-requiring) [Granulibacter bethesdensis CGDN
MSRLTIYADSTPDAPLLRTEDPERIAQELSSIGVRFERWSSAVTPSPDDDEATILAAYRPYLNALMGETGAGTADVIRLRPDTPNLPALRQKFLSEHTHTEDEVRFFVHGSGNFILHVDDRVYDAHCTQGDLISVPTGIKHWFDAGETPFVTALRVFTDTTGWVAHYTGDPIADHFPAA